MDDHHRDSASSAKQNITAEGHEAMSRQGNSGDLVPSLLLKLHTFGAGRPREGQTALGSVTTRSRELPSQGNAGTSTTMKHI